MLLAWCRFCPNHFGSRCGPSTAPSSLGGAEKAKSLPRTAVGGSSCRTCRSIPILAQAVLVRLLPTLSPHIRQAPQSYSVASGALWAHALEPKWPR